MEQMTTPKQRVQMMLDAIYAVRKNAVAAQLAGDNLLHRKLMADLHTLQVCLVGDVQMLVDELDRMKPYLIKGGKSS